MKISVIVPAFNEEQYLRATLTAIVEALEALPESELIVVDNESLDNTSDIAREFGARVIPESVHNISAVRNTGGRAASGDILIFVDADTCVPPGLFARIGDIMADDMCGGGAVAVTYGPAERKWVHYYLSAWLFWGTFLKMRQGACQFCRRSAFLDIGGYDETIFVGEDVEFHWRLDKYCQVAGFHSSYIDQMKVTASARRYDKMGIFRTLLFTHPITIFLGWRLKWLWKDWYENAVR